MSIATTTQQSTAPAYGAITDHEAINAILSGRREMFEVIVRRYNTRLYRVGMAYLRSHALAEDAMQNTYLKAFLKMQSFEGTAAFSTWLTRIMITECLMILRNRKRSGGEPFDNSVSAFERNVQEPSAIDSVDAKEVKALLEQCIQDLPRLYRAVYILREIQQLSTTETAACLGLSVNNVKVSLHRAREALRIHLLETSAGEELFSYSALFCNPMTARIMKTIMDRL